MKLIFYSYYGTYAAYIMAAVHAGICADNRKFTKKDIDDYYEFCIKYGDQYGNMIFVGTDQNLAQVYCLGHKNFAEIVRHGQLSMNDIFNIEDQAKYINVQDVDGKLPQIIQRMGKYVLFTGLSRNLFQYWFIKKYPIILKKYTLLKNIGAKIE